jgi:hypothetical protein
MDQRPRPIAQCVQMLVYRFQALWLGTGQDEPGVEEVRKELFKISFRRHWLGSVKRSESLSSWPDHRRFLLLPWVCRLTVLSINAPSSLTDIQSLYVLSLHLFYPEVRTLLPGQKFWNYKLKAMSLAICEQGYTLTSLNNQHHMSRHELGWRMLQHIGLLLGCRPVCLRWGCLVVKNFGFGIYV